MKTMLSNKMKTSKISSKTLGPKKQRKKESRSNKRKPSRRVQARKRRLPLVTQGTPKSRRSSINVYKTSPLRWNKKSMRRKSI